MAVGGVQGCCYKLLEHDVPPGPEHDTQAPLAHRAPTPYLICASLWWLHWHWIGLPPGKYSSYPGIYPLKTPEDRYMCSCQPETAAGRWEGGHLAEVKCLLTDQQGRQLEASPPTPNMEAKQVHSGDR